MRSAPTRPHPRHSHVGARPARDFAGRARSYRLPGNTVFLPRRSGPCPRWPDAPARFADKIRSYAAPPMPFPCRSAPCARYRGQGPLLQVAGKHGIPPRSGPCPRWPDAPARFADKIRYAAPPTPLHVGARPARDFAGRARSYRLPGNTVFLPRRSGPCPRWPDAPARFADKIRSYAAPPTPFPCRSAPCARFRGQGPLLQVAGKRGIPPRKRTLSAMAGRPGAIRG